MPSGTFGNEQRNGLRGPDWQSFDLSLQRRIRFEPRVAATVRWDIFNVFNRRTSACPTATSPTRPPFGTITTLAGDPRIMQLSARITF